MEKAKVCPEMEAWEEIGRAKADEAFERISLCLQGCAI
jgi:hypothetical protein